MFSEFLLISNSLFLCECTDLGLLMHELLDLQIGSLHFLMVINLLFKALVDMPSRYSPSLEVADLPSLEFALGLSLV